MVLQTLLPVMTGNGGKVERKDPVGRWTRDEKNNNSEVRTRLVVAPGVEREVGGGPLKGCRAGCGTCRTCQDLGIPVIRLSSSGPFGVLGQMRCS